MLATELPGEVMYFILDSIKYWFVCLLVCLKAARATLTFIRGHCGVLGGTFSLTGRLADDEPFRFRLCVVVGWLV